MGDETTNIANDTYQLALDQANLNFLADALRAVKLGHFFSNIKVVAASLSSASAFDITTAAFKAASTITGIALATGENLPPIGVVKTLRVVTGTATGPRVVTDAGGTPIAPNTYAGIATLSDDGKTLTFEAAVTAFTFEYQPRSAIDTQSIFSLF